MEIHFCKNHTERIAHYRCYFCKASICHDCRLTLRHHYFCSHICFLKYNYSIIRKNLENKKGLILVLSHFLLFLLIFFQFIFFQRKADHIIKTHRSVGQDTLYIPSVKSFLNGYHPEYQHLQLSIAGKQKQNFYTVDLSLKKGWVVNFWNNSQPELSEIMKSDTINTFTVPLTYGKNHLQLLIIDHNLDPVIKDEIDIHYTKPTVEALKNSVDMGKITKKMVALTFDGGSEATHTKEILSILKKQQVRCTMFLTGKFMEKYPDIVEEIIQDGHEIANHTYDHPHLTTYAQNASNGNETYVDFNYIQMQLFRTDSIFSQITGQHLKPFWRAPFGEYNQQILTWAAQMGYLHIRWTSGFDTFDWVVDESSKLYRTPQEFLDHFKRQEKNRSSGLNGVIVLMHLGSIRNQDHIFEALPHLIEFTKKNGYALVPISSLLQN
jgi:peptidoglycan/xylan/chitin deacetylase (PgdA/CDA1 family)